MNNILDLENDIPKYKKKKNSTISKSLDKSKHKHEYVDCLLIVGNRKYPYKAAYCKVCGKIGDMHLFETEKTDNGLPVLSILVNFALPDVCSLFFITV